ncbi:hypothetical protein A0H81_12063 [Grifola frondosa]|uniref:Uncharacterized protein n=1 Tax=Grifola frondosa TaxID=5627 RepID=A0A1C7LSR6_GRIFR|nr:hypothetical protein A0H81_12063 [Grifola frondosa]
MPCYSSSWAMGLAIGVSKQEVSPSQSATTDWGALSSGGPAASKFQYLANLFLPTEQPLFNHADNADAAASSTVQQSSLSGLHRRILPLQVSRIDIEDMIAKLAGQILNQMRIRLPRMPCLHGPSTGGGITMSGLIAAYFVMCDFYKLSSPSLKR